MVAAKQRPQRELLHVQCHSSVMHFSAVIQIAEEEAGRGCSRSRLRRAGGRESLRAAAFACSSASSLPLFPLCPGTQYMHCKVGPAVQEGFELSVKLFNQVLARSWPALVEGSNCCLAVQEYSRFGCVACTSDDVECQGRPKDLPFKNHVGG